MPSTLTLDLDYSPAFVEGARNAVFTCLAVEPGEKVVLLTDERNRAIAAALIAQLKNARADLAPFVIENLGPRPMTTLPAAVAEAMETAQVSIFCASAGTGELPMRIAMTAIVNRRRMRHGHMVNISPRIMVEGMRADFRQVDALSRWVWERAKKAQVMTARSAAGSDLRATFDPQIKWLKTSGLISPDKWGNLPGGEVLTAPARVDGVYVCDGVLGDWLAAKYGDMKEHPLTIEIADSRIVRTTCSRKDILADFDAYVRQHENGNRVGEWALGTNLAVKDVIGEILQDEKIPGLHIAFGHPYAEHTGAKWVAPTHIDIVGRSFDVDFDGEPVMRKSRYLVDPTTLQ